MIHVDPTAVVVAVIGATSTIVVAVIARVGKQADRRFDVVEEKIDGISNGHPSEVKVAIARLLREKTERQLFGLPLRRSGDHVGEPDSHDVRGSDEARDVLHNPPEASP